MGVVYEAFDRETRTAIALKALRRFEPQMRLRFKREFRAAQDIHHPNLVRLGELVEEQGRLFYTMELIDGVDFLTYVRPDASARDASPPAPTRDLRESADVDDAPAAWHVSLDEERLRNALRQLALGLSALHADGKLHRDVKPSNVLVEPSGRAILLDFGLVLPTAETRLTGDGGAVGTAVYMAPEQAVVRELGPAADWYAVGVMLYEALTGRIPFEGTNYQILVDKQKREPVPPHTWNPGAPPDLDALCVELLRTDPAARPDQKSILGALGADAAATVQHPARVSRPSWSTSFVGRQPELDALRAAYADAAGETVCVLVHGESGMGKSELVRQLTRDIADDEPLVLAGRCYERESLPYKGVDGVIDALSEYLANLSRSDASALLPDGSGHLREMFPVLRRVEAMSSQRASRGRAIDPLERRTAAFAALREVLVRIAARRRLVVVIDDLQWADRDSLVLLGDLVAGSDAPRMLLILTVRASARDELPELVVRHLPASVCARHIRVGPLDDAAALALVAQLAPELAASPAAIGAIVSDARGHPLFLHELSRYAAARSDHSGAVRVDDALWTRVCALPDGARAVMEVVSVAGAPLAQSIVAQAAELDGASWTQSSAVLRAGYLVRTAGASHADTIEPYHDRVREAITAHLSPQTLRRVHERLVIALDCAGAAEAHPEQLVDHLAAIGEDDRAARHAQRAGEAASRALAFDRAAALYETTLRLGRATFTPHEKAEVCGALAEALANAGRAAEAGDAFLRAAENVDAAAELMCCRRAAEQFLISGHIPRGLTALESVLRHFGVSLPPTPQAALRSLIWNRAKVRLRGRRWRQRTEHQIAPEELVRFDVYRAIARGLGTVDTIRGMDFQARALLLALRLGEPTRVATATAFEAIFAAAEGGRKVHTARGLLDDARSIAEGCDDATLDVWLDIAEAMLSMFSGRFADSLAHIDHVERRLRDEVGNTWELNNTRVFRLQVLRFRGDFVRLRREVAQLANVAERRGDRYSQTTLSRTRSLLSMLDGDVEAAREALLVTTWQPPEGVFHMQHWYTLRARTELALYEGTSTAQLDDLVSTYGALERSKLTRVQLTRALALWARGRIYLVAHAERGRPEHLRAARRMLAALRRENMYAATWSHLLEAGVTAHTRGPGTAAGALRAALACAEQHGMDLFAAIARDRLGAVLGGDEGDELRAAARAWTTAQAIAEPDRVIDAMCPGFERA